MAVSGQTEYAKPAAKFSLIKNMTKENVHQYLPLIQALAEGKIIQEYIGGDNEWIDNDTPWFQRPHECYRIKPEPREWSMVVGNDGKLYQPELCRSFAQSLTIRVREILD
jgi:hypothetical protein